MRHLENGRRSGSLYSLCVLLVLTLAVAMLPGHAILAQGPEYIKANYTKYEYRIPMRDGKRLWTAVYAPKDEARDVKLPYVALTANVVGVDDARSRYYNRIVRVDQTPDRDWDSAETMRRPDGLYEWGVFVNHNTSPAAPGAGSCIFLHIWRGPDRPTAGCTAMSPDRMVGLVTWLDPKARPVLVQLPREEYGRLAAAWGLPTPSLR